MSTVQALREQLAFHNREANRLISEKGSRAWSANDQMEFDQHMDAADSVQREINTMQNDMDADTLKNFKDARRLPAGAGKAPKSAAQAGFNVFLRKGPGEWSEEDTNKVSNAMSTTTPSEGGYTLAPGVASVLTDSLKDFGSVRRVSSRLQTTKGNAFSMAWADGRSELGERVADGVDSTAADPTFGTAPVNAYKFGSKVITVPIELLQDASIDVAGMVMKRCRDRIGRVQNTYFSTGSGASQPFGITAAALVGQVGATGDTGLEAITFERLVDLVECLDVAYLEEGSMEGVAGAAVNGMSLGPGWMFNQTVRRHLRKIKDTSGRPVWTPSYDAGITVKSDLLLGYPVYLNNDIPTPAANAKSLVFGNYGQYLVRDALEVQIFRFEDSVYSSKGQVGFLALARAGGNLLDPASIVSFQHSAS